MMKNKSSLRRTRRGYTLRLTKLEFDELRAMVAGANNDFDYEEIFYGNGGDKKKLRACQSVMRILNS